MIFQYFEKIVRYLQVQWVDVDEKTEKAMHVSPLMEKNVRTFITTPHFFHNYEKNDGILMGAWCRIYGNVKSFDNARILSYHWDDHTKAENDCIYLKELRHRLIPLLSKELNALHETNYSDRAWHLILGYWLTQFLTVAFDRWSMIEAAIEQNEQLVSNLIDYDWRQLIPRDTSEAGAQFVDDLWNHVFIGQLMEKWTNIRIVKDAPTANSSITVASDRPNRQWHSLLRMGAKYLLRTFFRLSFVPGRNFVLVSTGMSLRNLLHLRLELSGTVFYEPTFLKLPKVDFNEGMRRWGLPEYQTDKRFEKIVKKLIPMWMPSSFVEGFSLIKSDNNGRGGHPDVIFTANNHFSDDAFKFWAASKIDAGCKLVVGLHGGGVPFRFHSSLEFEAEICDLYVVLGDADRRYPHVRDVGQFWAKLKYGHWDPKGFALVVTVAMPRYTFDLRSMALAGQMLSYFEDQFAFYHSLSTEIQQQTIVRMMKNEASTGWKIPERWLDRFPSVKLDDGVVPMKKLVKKARLFISTYNATTFNESLAANIPTVIYWDKNCWETIEWANSDFDMLMSVGIFHETSESAAEHVKAVWDDVAQWWQDPKVQAVRDSFCRKYAYRHSSVIPKLAAVLREATGA